MYTLQNADLTVTLTEYGGMLTSICSTSGLEYLWQGNPEHWAGQAPVCFPICGGLRDGKAVTRDGKTIALGRHGFARQQRFEVVEKSEQNLTFQLTDSLETFDGYPFAFALRISYTLEGKNLRVTYDVTNTGQTPLPFTIGGHPAFNCPLEKGLAFEDYQLAFDQEITQTALKNVSGGLLSRKERVMVPFDGKKLALKQKLFAEGALVFEEITSKSICLESAKGTASITITYEDFSNLLVWTSGTNAPFVALEPWTGLATLAEETDIFEEKAGMRELEKGQSATYAYTMRFEEQF